MDGRVAVGVVVVFGLFAVGTMSAFSHMPRHAPGDYERHLTGPETSVPTTSTLVPSSMPVPTSTRQTGVSRPADSRADRSVADTTDAGTLEFETPAGHFVSGPGGNGSVVAPTSVVVPKSE